MSLGAELQPHPVAALEKEGRNLRYAWNWVRSTDPNGYLEMLGSRTATSAETRWYFANHPSSAIVTKMQSKLSGRPIRRGALETFAGEQELILSGRQDGLLSALRMALSNASLLIGLRRNWTAPAERAERSSSSEAWALRKMIGTGFPF